MTDQRRIALACTLGCFLVFALAGISKAGEGGSTPRDDAGEACAVRRARAVQDHYRDLGSLSAGFVQTTRTVTIGATRLAHPAEVYRGTLILQKPGKMRWTYDSPEPSTVISDGETLWIYDPEAREVQKMPMVEGLAEMAGIQFLLGERDILQDFRVSTQICDVEKTTWLNMVPRKVTNYETLRLLVETKTGRVIATEVHDLFGNVTKVEFLNMTRNAPVPPSSFSFTIPPDVNVIELSPAPAGKE